ncbi:hypothetical protein PC129_g11092 [Phytophthora cactorum]|uniref:PiggyBac transposable element-derived protein domain-containing protein n=1 Tax=Phytophthora cactorum TaxID=29920 RepID=A0A329S202_9STRA|nr:hypothetical protein Pcac1_g3929 [Phytophthora cactorum]KAG2822795.1 hypothetical protein PC111_g10485 [Phytophthora cactorum]KAG2854447.1 hypothetical protein PC113_g13296 [Phytophthora cactorum]KAG2902739.1 hypothetical protein PC114_g12591 [Phytophthora cactorum]KAG2912846.1 hypothetical protein PC115_g12197 [Phytophthora cactorum]
MLADDVDAYAVIDSDEEERHEIDSEYYENVDINIDACDDISSVEDEEAVKADDELLETSQHKTQIKAMKPFGWRYDIKTDSTSAQEYAGLYKGASVPSEAVLAIAESPISLFVFFMPKRLWQRVASESNRYHGKMTTQRAAKFQTRQKARRSKDSSVDVPTRKDIRQRLREMKHIEPHELIVALGLVIARMMCPH